jgi:hypothetical protein
MSTVTGQDPVPIITQCLFLEQETNGQETIANDKKIYRYFILRQPVKVWISDGQNAARETKT